MSPRGVRVTTDSFPIRGTFTIARGSRTKADVLTVEIEDSATGRVGRGECVPYAHYGETIAATKDQILALSEALQAGLDRAGLIDRLPAGAARNGIDAALWDLECKLAHAEGLPSPIDNELDGRKIHPVRTARTLSLASPSTMAAEAREVADRFETLKLKLGGESVQVDLERVAAVRDVAPTNRLIVDANESWQPQTVESSIASLAPFALALIEQPLPAGSDQALEHFEHAVPICADESFHTAADLDRIATQYDVVNLKLDKTGGLTHALEVKRTAMNLGLGIMVGCMVGTSLAMAPALVLAQSVDLVDLDGPYLLARDRSRPLELAADGWIGPSASCWG